MFKNKKKEEKDQELCPEDASLWAKLHNGPYLQTHPKILVGYIFYSIITQYIMFLGAILAYMYISTSILGAVGVLAG